MTSLEKFRLKHWKKQTAREFFYSLSKRRLLWIKKHSGIFGERAAQVLKGEWL